MMTTDNRGQLSGDISRRTAARQRIVAAYSALVLARHRGPFRVGEIARRARVARSTFYDHFGGTAAVQAAALDAPFATIAETLTGNGEDARLTALLVHFWDYRQQARPMFAGREGARLEAILAAKFQEQLVATPDQVSPDVVLLTVQLAAATLAPLRLWLNGAFPMPPEAFAAQLMHTGLRMCRALDSTHPPVQAA